MRRRLNLKFAACLLVALVVFGAGVHFLHGFQVRRNAGGLLKQADRAEAEGRLDLAADYLRRYLGLAPRNADARARYGLLLADKRLAKSPRALLGAFFVLEEVLRQKPERDDIRRKVIDVAMDRRLERFPDAGQHLDILLGSARSDGELLGLRGQCHQALGELTQARECFERAKDNRPHDPENYIRLAYLLREHAAKVKKKTEGTVVEVAALADATMDAMVKANANSFAAHLSRARYRKNFTTPATAEATAKLVAADVRQAQQLAPKETDVLLAVAELDEENGKIAEARASLHKGLDLHPTEYRMYQALAQLEVRHGQPEEARKCLKAGLKRLPQQIDLLWNMAYLLTKKEHQEEAKSAIANLRAKGFPKADLDYLGARLLVADEQWLAASKLLEGAYPQLLSRHNQRKDWFSFNLAQEANLLLGFCCEQLGDADRAAAAYGRALVRSPRSEQARHGLARTRWALGQLGAALDEYRLLVSLPTAPRVAWIELAQLLIIRNLQVEQPDWNEVKQVLDLAAKLDPPPIEVPLLRMEVLAAQKDYSGAQKALLKDHADKETRPVEIWVGLAGLEERQGHSQAALAMLDEAEKHHGDQVELRLARARYWARHPGTEARQALEKLTQDLGKLSPPDRLRLLRRTAGAYLAIGENKEAERLWQQVAQQYPSDLGSRLVLLDLRADARDAAGIKEQIKDLKRIEGTEGTLWRYAEARLLVLQAEGGDKKKALNQARDLLELVGKRRPGWSRVPLLQGQIEDLAGRGSTALVQYRHAVALGEQSPTLIGRMVQLLTEREQYAEAEQMVRKLQNQKTPLGDLDQVAAVIALRRQNTPEAVRLALKAVPRDEKDQRRLVWLGHVLWAAGQLPKADETFRRALRLDEKEPYPWVAYVEFLVRTKEKTRAEEIVREAERKLPKDAAYLALAQCFQTLGDKERAGKLFEEALAARPEDVAVLRAAALFHLSEKRTNQAQRYFERIIDLKGNTTNEAKDARRALALVLASAENYQQSQKALHLLGLLDQDTPVDAAEPEGIDRERTRALVLATQPGVRQRRQAASLLEGLQRRQLLTADEQFLLLKTYESIGEKKKAHAQTLTLLTAMEQKLAAAPQDKAQLAKAYAAYLTHAIANSLREKRLNEAQLWLTRLEALEPNSFRTIASKAHVLAKQGQAAAMVPTLKAMAQAQEDLVRPIAMILEQIGQAAAAQELYEKFAARAKQPEDVLLLARFYARQKLIAKALDLCEGAWKTCKPEEVGKTAVTLVYTAKVTDAQAERVAGWLEQAIGKHPDKVDLTEQLAAVRRFQGRHEDTIELYRRIVAKDKANPVAINNLAWLLAMTGKGNEALTTIQRAIDLEGRKPGLLDTEAVIYLRLGQHEKAVEDLLDATAETPSPHYYFHLAQAYHQARDQKAAARALRQARDLGLSENTIDVFERTSYQQLTALLDSQSR